MIHISLPLCVATTLGIMKNFITGRKIIKNRHTCRVFKALSIFFPLFGDPSSVGYFKGQRADRLFYHKALIYAVFKVFRYKRRKRRHKRRAVVFEGHEIYYKPRGSDKQSVNAHRTAYNEKQKPYYGKGPRLNLSTFHAYSGKLPLVQDRLHTRHPVCVFLDLVKLSEDACIFTANDLHLLFAKQLHKSLINI